MSEDNDNILVLSREIGKSENFRDSFHFMGAFATNPDDSDSPIHTTLCGILVKWWEPKYGLHYADDMMKPFFCAECEKVKGDVCDS